MPLSEWEQLFALSDRHGFVIASDECYSEIYFRDEPPLGGLEAARAARPHRLPPADRIHQPVQAQQRARHAIGLRGRRRGADEAVPAVPHLPRQRDERPVQAASIAAWNDEAHVVGQPRAVPRKFAQVTPLLAA
jgi:N-succinyldiaminopimelate aminotransferase